MLSHVHVCSYTPPSQVEEALGVYPPRCPVHPNLAFRSSRSNRLWTPSQMSPTGPSLTYWSWPTFPFHLGRACILKASLTSCWQNRRETEMRDGKEGEGDEKGLNTGKQ